MDNAQDYPLDLGAPFEVTADRAIIPAQQPTMQVNPQKQVGDLMTNAIKYEGDGIFVDKYHYQAEVASTYPITSDFLSDGVKLAAFEGGVLFVIDTETGTSFYLQLQKSCTAETGEISTFNRVNDTDYNVTGILKPSDEPFDLSFNLFTAEQVTPIPPTWAPSWATARIDPTGRGRFTINIGDNDVKTLQLALPLSKDIAMTAYERVYSGTAYDNDKYTFRTAAMFLSINAAGTSVTASGDCLLTAPTVLRTDPDSELENDAVTATSQAVLSEQAGKTQGVAQVTGIMAYGPFTREDELNGDPNANPPKPAPIKLNYTHTNNIVRRFSRADWDFNDEILFSMNLTSYLGIHCYATRHIARRNEGTIWNDTAAIPRNPNIPHRVFNTVAAMNGVLPAAAGYKALVQTADADGCIYMYDSAALSGTLKGTVQYAKMLAATANPTAAYVSGATRVVFTAGASVATLTTFNGATWGTPTVLTGAGGDVIVTGNNQTTGGNVGYWTYNATTTAWTFTGGTPPAGSTIIAAVGYTSTAATYPAIPPFITGAQLLSCAENLIYTYDGTSWVAGTALTNAVNDRYTVSGSWRDGGMTNQTGFAQWDGLEWDGYTAAATQTYFWVKRDAPWADPETMWNRAVSPTATGAGGYYFCTLNALRQPSIDGNEGPYYSYAVYKNDTGGFTWTAVRNCGNIRPSSYYDYEEEERIYQWNAGGYADYFIWQYALKNIDQIPGIIETATGYQPEASTLNGIGYTYSRGGTDITIPATGELVIYTTDWTSLTGQQGVPTTNDGFTAVGSYSNGVPIMNGGTATPALVATAAKGVPGRTASTYTASADNDGNNRTNPASLMGLNVGGFTANQFYDTAEKAQNMVGTTVLVKPTGTDAFTYEEDYVIPRYDTNWYIQYKMTNVAAGVRFVTHINTFFDNDVVVDDTAYPPSNVNMFVATGVLFLSRVWHATSTRLSTLNVMLPPDVMASLKQPGADLPPGAGLVSITVSFSEEVYGLIQSLEQHIGLPFTSSGLLGETVGISAATVDEPPYAASKTFTDNNLTQGFHVTFTDDTGRYCIVNYTATLRQYSEGSLFGWGGIVVDSVDSHGLLLSFTQAGTAIVPVVTGRSYDDGQMWTFNAADGTSYTLDFRRARSNITADTLDTCVLASGKLTAGMTIAYEGKSYPVTALYDVATGVGSLSDTDKRLEKQGVLPNSVLELLWTFTAGCRFFLVAEGSFDSAPHLAWISQVDTTTDTTITFDAGWVTIGKSGESFLQVNYKDIQTGDTGSVQSKTFLQELFIEANREIAALRMQNQWYIDAETVLGLKEDYFYILRRTEVADIEGGHWESIFAIRKGNLTANMPYWGVSGAVDTAPFFWRMSIAETKLTIEYAELLGTATVPAFKSKEIDVSISNSAQPSAAVISSLMPLGAVNVSAVARNSPSKMLYLGLFFSKLQQFALKIEPSGNTVTIHNGFGYVGINGLLTGGAYPSNKVGVASGLNSYGVIGENGTGQGQFVFRDGAAGVTIAVDVFKGTAVTVPTQVCSSSSGGSYNRYNPAVGVNVSTGSIQNGGLIPRPYLDTVFNAGTACSAFSISSASGWHIDALPTYPESMNLQNVKSTMPISTNVLYTLAKALSAVAMNGAQSAALSQNITNGAYGGTGTDQEFNAAAAAAAISQQQKDQAARIAGITPAGANEVRASSGCQVKNTQWFLVSEKASMNGGPGFAQVQAAYCADYEADISAQGMGEWFGIRVLSPMIAKDISFNLPYIGHISIPLSVGAEMEMEGLAGEQSGKIDASFTIAGSRIIGKHAVFSYPANCRQAEFTSPDISLTRKRVPFTISFAKSAANITTERDSVERIVNNTVTMLPQGVHCVQGSKRITPSSLEFSTKMGESSGQDKQFFSALTDNLKQIGANLSGNQGGSGGTVGSNDRLADNGVGDTLNGLQYADVGLFDYCILQNVDLYCTAIGSNVIGYSARDTKLIDGQANNIVVLGTRVYMAAPYTSLSYGTFQVRFFAKPLQADALMINCTGYNVIKNNRLYHGFDGIFFRNESTTGRDTKGDEEITNSVYSVNNEVGSDFKTGNVAPPTAYFGVGLPVPVPAGMFKSKPSQYYCKAFGNFNKALINLQGYRYSVPIAHETVSYLPHMIKTYTTYKSHVIDGVTSLTTELRTDSVLMAQVAPVYVDFPINGQNYRAGKDYISSVVTQSGVVMVNPQVMAPGFEFIGATVTKAYFYVPPERAIYIFQAQGGTQAPQMATELVPLGDIVRILELYKSSYDFINQESVAAARVADRDILLRLTGDAGFASEIYWPNKTIVLDPKELDMYGMAGGLVLAGHRRFQINRFFVQDYMMGDLIRNRRRWTPVKGDKLSDFWGERDYGWEHTPDGQTPATAIIGYYYEPFKQCWSYLGTGDEDDNMYEWEITFGLNKHMRELWGDKYVKVNVASAAITPGGYKESEVTHVYLKQDLFTRSPDTGYYSVRYQGLLGASAGEQLYIWSDGFFGCRAQKVSIANVSNRRQSVLITRPDISGMTEL